MVFRRHVSKQRYLPPSSSLYATLEGKVTRRHAFAVHGPRFIVPGAVLEALHPEEPILGVVMKIMCRVFTCTNDAALCLWRRLRRRRRRSRRTPASTKGRNLVHGWDNMKNLKFYSLNCGVTYPEKFKILPNYDEGTGTRSSRMLRERRERSWRAIAQKWIWADSLP